MMHTDLQTQIQSFELRFERQCNNAINLAEYLDINPAIRKVWYPGLKTHPSYETANKFLEVRVLVL